MKFSTVTVNCLLYCGALLLLAGCASTPVESPAPVFYPPAPEAPRIQYLTSYSVSSDLVPKTGTARNFILGIKGGETGALVKPYGLAIHESVLYVTDTVAPQINMLDFENKEWTIFRPQGKGKLRKPINVVVDGSGRYVTDPLRGEVVVYDRNGNYIGAFGKEDKIKPSGIALTKDRIYVGDLNEHRIMVYRKADRSLLFSFPPADAAPEESVHAPTNLAIGPDGRVYISDTGACRIQAYEADGTFVRGIGGRGTGIGRFVRNKGVAVDRNSNLYAVDAAVQAVQIFNNEAELLLFFGEPEGSPVPLVLPADLLIDYDNVDLFQPLAAPGFNIDYLIFITNQYGPRKVAVYGFGSMAEPENDTVE